MNIVAIVLTALAIIVHMLWAALVVCVIILIIQNVAEHIKESKEFKREKKRAAKHEGKWYVVCDEDTVRRCSNCGSIFRMYKEFFFCPHCGQKMEGVVR